MDINNDATTMLEEGDNLTLDFTKIKKVAELCENVIPVVVQNFITREVILLAYTNQEAFEKSIQTKIATFWSTSRNELWIKGKGSGNLFELKEVYVNCEQNSLLYLVQPKGEGICHTKNSKGIARNCFYRTLHFNTDLLENMDP